MWLKETSELAPSPEQSPSSSPLSQLAKETKGTETKRTGRECGMCKITLSLNFQEPQILLISLLYI